MAPTKQSTRPFAELVKTLGDHLDHRYGKAFSLCLTFLTFLRHAQRVFPRNTTVCTPFNVHYEESPKNNVNVQPAKCPRTCRLLTCLKIRRPPVTTRTLYRLCVRPKVHRTQARSKQCTIGPTTVLWDHAHYLCKNKS